SAFAGAPYSASLSASGGTPPYVWTAVNPLPSGLFLSQNGTITGTPLTSGTYSFAVRVIDSAQANAIASFTLRVGAPALSIVTNSPLPSGTVGQPYNQSLTATGGAPPYRWAVGQGLPAGLTLDQTTGTIAGTPAAPGAFNFQVLAADTNQGLATR